MGSGLGDVGLHAPPMDIHGYPPAERFCLHLPTSPRPHVPTFPSPLTPDNLISVTAPKLYNKGSSINKQ
ncbi:MAG: hypothetical protein ACKPAE_11685 [Microcystis panniformis]